MDPPQRTRAVLHRHRRGLRGQLPGRSSQPGQKATYVAVGRSSPQAAKKGTYSLWVCLGV